MIGIDKDIQVFEQACSLFVPFVESGFIDPNDPLVEGIVRRYLDVFTDKNIDTLILGCTHYPILSPIIKKVMGEGVALINTGEAAALKVKEILTNGDMLAEKKGESHFFVSDTTQTFMQTSEILLGKSLDFDVQKIDIEKY